MNYEQIRHRIPEGLPKKKRKQRVIGPKSVLLFFFAAMLLFETAGVIIQGFLGMTGVMITELLLLAGSVGYAVWTGVRLRDIFPVRKPVFSGIAGTVVMWIGGYMLMITGSLLFSAFIGQFVNSSDADVILSADLNWPALFFIIAVLPPVCEEAMHRGVIQYGLQQKIGNPWVISLVIGVIFGVFHMDLNKFAATGILGGVMGWMMFRTGNMVYSSLFHFIHNSFTLLIIALVPEMNTVSGTLLAASASGSGDGISDYAAAMYSAGGMSIFFGLMIPWILYIGNWLLTRDLTPRRLPLFPADPAERRRTVKRILLVSAGFAAMGITALFNGWLLG